MMHRKMSSPQGGITEQGAFFTGWKLCDLGTFTLRFYYIATLQAHLIPLAKLTLSKLTPLFTTDPISCSWLG